MFGNGKIACGKSSLRRPRGGPCRMLARKMTLIDVAVAVAAAAVDVVKVEVIDQHGDLGLVPSTSTF